MSTAKAPGGLQGVDEWPLLERAADLGALHAAIAAAREGAGGFVLVRAHAGIGKTRLLGEAAQLARASDMAVLRAGGSVLERDFPFGVVLRLLERRLRDASADERARVFEGSAALAAPMLLGDQPVEQALAAGSEASLVHALQWVAINLSSARPLVLVVDDLHWADAQSIRLLTQLATRIDELALAIIAATRPREPGSEAGLLAQLAGVAGVRVVQPRALSTAASETLVRGSVGRGDAFVRACFEQTGGNPLLLRELLRELAAEGVEGTDADADVVRAIGPEAIAHGVEATLARLGPACAALATAVAVLAVDTELGTAARLADLDIASASRATAALQDAGLFDDDEALRFRHPLLRRAAYERLAPAARGALHREAARILLDRVAPHDVASHLILAPCAGESWAVEALRAAAREASALAGHTAAAKLLRRALQEPPSPDDRPAVLEEAALAAVRAGEGDAVPALRAAIEASPDAPGRARLWLALARAYYQRGLMGASAEAADEGLAALRGAPEHPSLVLELEAAWNASALWTPGGGAAVTARASRMVESEAPARTHGERELLAWLSATELVRGEDRERSLRFARRAWADGTHLRESTGNSAAMGPMISAMLRAGALDETLALLDVLLDDARRRASPFDYAGWRTARGTCLLHLGRLGEAEGDLEEALEARALGWEATVPLAVDALVSVYVEQDRLADAAALLETVGPVERNMAGGAMASGFSAARGRVALASGDPRTAREQFLVAGHLLRDVLGSDNPALQRWRGETALAARQLGDLDEATTYAAEELRYARQWGAPRPLAFALRTQAIVVGGAAGIELAAEAAAVAEAGGVVLEQAQALGTQGALLRADRQRTRARELLRHALDLAGEHEAHALVRVLREELVAAGGKPRRVRTRGPNALTVGERRVASLAAEGLTNRQIADALFVTPKAVGFHLGNTYRKLQIEGRGQLQAALLRDR